MSFVKRNYVDGETVITAQNLNDIQDELIRQGEQQAEDEAELALKANTADVQTALALKADKTDTYTKAQVDSMLQEAVEEAVKESEYSNFEMKSVSGDFIHITDGAGLIPVKDLKIGIDAVQDLHGYDHPWVGGAGKNLLDQSAYVATTGCTYSNGKFTANVQSDCNGVMVCYFDANNHTVYTVLKAVGEQGSRCSIPIVVDDTWETMLIGYNMSGKNIAVKYPKPSTNGNYAVSFTLDKIPTTSVYGEFSNIQVETGSTATDYAPYSNICPISGWDEVNVNVSGINVWDEEWELGYYDITGSPVSGNSNIRCKNYIPVTPNETYYFKTTSATMYICLYDDNKNFLSNIGRLAVLTQSYTIPSEARYMRFNMAGVYGTTYNHDISINYPSTDTDYHAYNGQTYTIDLDGTRYGGTLDVTTGELVVTWAKSDMGSLTWGYSSADVRFYISGVNYKRPSSSSLLANAMCSNYKITTLAGLVNGCICLYSNGYIYVKDTAYTDATSFKNALTETNAQLVYELAEPQTYQLTSTEVLTLLGENNIFADTGAVEELIYRISRQ